MKALWRRLSEKTHESRKAEPKLRQLFLRQTIERPRTESFKLLSDEDFLIVGTGTQAAKQLIVQVSGAFFAIPDRQNQFFGQGKIFTGAAGR